MRVSGDPRNSSRVIGALAAPLIAGQCTHAPAAGKFWRLEAFWVFPFMSAVVATRNLEIAVYDSVSAVDSLNFGNRDLAAGQSPVIYLGKKGAVVVGTWTQFESVILELRPNIWLRGGRDQLVIRLYDGQAGDVVDNDLWVVESPVIFS